MPINLLLCDDHKIMLDGLKSLFKTEKEFQSIHTAESAKEALEVISNEDIDVAVLDINMPDTNGIELAKIIKNRYPFIKVVMLSMNNSLPDIQQSIEAGASGYILKNANKKELLEGIKKVASKGKYYSREVSEILISGLISDGDEKDQHPKTFELTPREIEILKLIIKEYSNTQIADELHISEHTVETHRKNLFRKTNTKSLVGLVKYVYDNKLL